jgi:predicted RNase H-like HicB family nuclease
MNKTYNIRLEWNIDHYDVFIAELGKGIQATGKSREEALRHADEAISRSQFAQLEKQKTA